MTYYSNAGLQVSRSRKLYLIAAAAAVGVAVAFLAIAQNASAITTVAKYDSVPNPLPSSTPSLGFEAQQTAEFGAKVQFAPGERVFDNVKVVMNSWACESGQWEQMNCTTTPGATFQQELTLNIYSEAGGVLTPIKTVTQTFAIPYRPSVDPTCGPNATQWRNAAGTCQNGFNVPVTFNLNSTVLPDEVVYGIEYNTLAWGYAPIRATGPYDSLNVSVVSPASATTGTTGATYRAFGSNPVFAVDPDYSGVYVPAVQFNAVGAQPVKATNKDQCKDGGWKNFQTAYKNQGECVASVQSSPNSKLNR